jgi:hypothetical protein
MKSLLFAAALSFSSLALAQSASTSQSTAAQPSGQTVNDPSQSTGPRGVTQQNTVPNGQASAPAGANQGPGTSSGSQSEPFTPPPAAGEYPPCSRTVTDGCIQTYERGVRPSRGRR